MPELSAPPPLVPSEAEEDDEEDRAVDDDDVVDVGMPEVASWVARTEAMPAVPIAGSKVPMACNRMALFTASATAESETADKVDEDEGDEDGDAALSLERSICAWVLCRCCKWRCRT